METLLRHDHFMNLLKNDSNYQHSDDYYKSLLWMPPEKIKPLCQDLFKTMSKASYDSIQIENRDKKIREQSVSL